MGQDDEPAAERPVTASQSEYMLWASNGPLPIDRPVGCLPGVFRYTNPAKRIHMTEKPLQLMRDIVHICVPGGRILDPFAGAGTTILAAVQEGYEAVGVEVTDAYYRLGGDRVRTALAASDERMAGSVQRRTGHQLDAQKEMNTEGAGIHMGCLLSY